MTLTLPRRDVVRGTTALFGTALAAGLSGDPIGDIERRHGGRLGVFALDTGTGRTLAHRTDERFLLCSTFKGVLAAMVLARIDAGQDTLAALVAYGAKDVIANSPVTQAHVGAGALSVEALCAAILLFSDNGAANLLLARVGGPNALTQYARRLGDTTTQFDRYETAAGQWSGTRDTTTPRAIATTARSLLLGNALHPASRTRLHDWMVACQTGIHRLRASCPPSWAVADRTGTGDAQCNDYAVAIRPGQAPLVIATYYDATHMETAAQEAVLREAGAAIAHWAA